MAGYYVAQTHPNAVEVAKRNLLRQGLLYYDPREAKRIHRGSKTIVGSTQLFQNYLFIAVVAQWVRLKFTIGIRDILKFAKDRPAIISDDVIKAIRSREGPDGLLRLTLKPKFIPGQKVLIKDGPMQGVEALYSGQPSGERVAILLAIGRAYVLENDLVAA